MDNSNLGGFLAAHSRAVIGISAAVILLCVVAIIVAAVSQSKPARTFVEIAVVPTTAVVMINGTEYRNGVYEMAPGNYTAYVSQDGFDSAEVSVKAEAGKTMRLEAILLNQKEGMKYFERSAADLNVLSTMDDAGAQEFMEGYYDKLRIRGELPLEILDQVSDSRDGGVATYNLMRVEEISGDPNCKMAFCLMVTGDELDMTALREGMKQKGYNLDDYEVLYGF